MTLRVKLEIIPFGSEMEAYEIGRLDIFNKGERGFHGYRYGVIELTRRGGGVHDTEICHKREDGAWSLLRKTLNTLGIDGP